jgi:hypothetical protein
MKKKSLLQIQVFAAFLHPEMGHIEQGPVDLFHCLLFVLFQAGYQQENMALNEIKAEIASLKGLLLNRLVKTKLQ